MAALAHPMRAQTQGDTTTPKRSADLSVIKQPSGSEVDGCALTLRYLWETTCWSCTIMPYRRARPRACMNSLSLACASCSHALKSGFNAGSASALSLLNPLLSSSDWSWLIWFHICG